MQGGFLCKWVINLHFLLNRISLIKNDMLSKSIIKQLLVSSKPRLSQMGVSKIGLFGSARRDEMNEDSDIDILVDFENDKETYLNFIETCDFLESVFKEEKVEIVSLNGLSPFIGPHILKEVEYV